MAHCYRLPEIAAPSIDRNQWLRLGALRRKNGECDESR